MSLIAPALGKIDVDVLIENVRVANVLTGEVYPADIAIHSGKIVAVEPPGTQPARRAQQVIDGLNRIATPGLVDAHLHIESSCVTPAHFAQAVLPLGTTTVCEDPHEVANVGGVRAILAMMDASRGLPLKVEFLISSSVPSARGLEGAGGTITPDDVRELLGLPHVLGLAEVMDGAGAMMEDPDVMGILEAGGGLHGYRPFFSPVIEGHNPMLRGRALAAFVAAGVDSDHTQATPADLIEKARNGVFLMLQERYVDRDVIAAIETLPPDAFCLITDDVAPQYLEDAGHLDQVLRRCIALGMPPMRALRACTLNPARRMRLWDRGCIAPGRAADIVLVDSIEDFRARLVVVDGRIVARDGACLWQPPARENLHAFNSTVKLGGLGEADFVLRMADGRLQMTGDNKPPITAGHRPSAAGQVTVRTMDAVPTSSVREGRATVNVCDGAVALDAGDNLAFICIINRHGAPLQRAAGLLRNIGIARGAFATTIAHDAHNLCVVGRDAASMARAANAVIAHQGGFAVADGDAVTVAPLPLFGILSAQPVPAIAQQMRSVERALHAIGVVHAYWLMRLTTFTLPVSAGLRITDLGLIDAQARKIVPLQVD